MNEIKGKTTRMSRIGREGMLLSCIVLIVQLVIFLIFILASPRSAYSVPCNANNVVSLINTIIAANIGNCDNDTINLAAGTYTLTAVNNNTDGPNGLPSITSNITINCAGASTTIIERNVIGHAFRIFHVAATGNLTLNGLTISDGLAVFDGVDFDSNDGGGIFNRGTLTINNCTISDNEADNDSGGIQNSGNMTVNNSIISGNEAGGGGGGIENGGDLTITNSNISNNTAFVSIGGGIQNNGGTLSIENSTISSNEAGDSGAGIANVEGGTINIINSTISDNSSGFEGGGIFNSFGTVDMNNVTIAFNNAASGGGIFEEVSDTINLANTIIARNSASSSSPDCSGPLNSLGFNLIQNVSGCTISGDLTGNIIGQDPLLGPLANNGGPTQTNALLPGSPAINAGNPAQPDGVPPRCETTDQRGVTRPQGTFCDIGAFELQLVEVSISKSATYNDNSSTCNDNSPSPCPPIPAPQTSQITYTITLQSIGQGTATGVEVQDTLPSGAVLVSAFSSIGSCTELNDTVTCNVGTLSPNLPEATITIIINITPELGRTTIENTAMLSFLNEQQQPIEVNSNTVIIPVGVGPIDGDLTGTFEGNSTFDRVNPPFPEDDMAIDPTSLELVVASDGASFDGTFNAAWLSNVAITGTGSVNIVSFSGSFEEIMGAKCPGAISGTITLVSSNSVEVDGIGEDCKSPYTFTGTLIRPGAPGDGVGSSSGGCSIAQGATSTPSSMLPYLLISVLTFIRRWQRFNKKSLKLLFRRSKLAQKWLGKRENLLLFMLLSTTIWVLGLFITPPALAQTLIKDCPNSPSAPTLDVICSELKAIQDMDGNLTPQQLDLLNICTELIESETPNCDAIDQTEPELIAELYTDILRLQSNNLLKKLHIRLSAVRAGTASSVSLQGLAFNANDITFKDTRVADISPIIPFTVTNQVSTDQPSPFGKLGIFVNGSYNFGDRDQSTTQNGFDFNIFDVTGGVDYRFTNNFVLGVAFTYVRTDIDLDLSAGSLDTNAYYGSVYGSLYIFDKFYIDGLANFGWIDYSSERNINFTVDGTTVNQTANGDTNGFYYAFSANAGYDFHFEGLTFGPLGRFNYSQANIDGFQETIEGGGPGIGLALDVDDQEAKSLTTALGGQVSYAISTGWGVFLPQVIFEWVHEFEDTGNTSATFMAGSGLVNNPTINVQGEDPDRDTFNLGGGISAVFHHGVSAFVYYESILGWENVTSYYISGGIRFEL